MPNYKGHLCGGTVCFCLIVFVYSLQQAPYTQLLEWLGCILAGSLFPDIDTKSKGQKIFYIFLSGILCLCLMQQQLALFIGLAFAGMLPLLVNHRGLFHRLWFIAIVTGGITITLFTIYPWAQVRIVSAASFFMVGAISHLYLDMGIKKMLRVP